MSGIPKVDQVMVLPHISVLVLTGYAVDMEVWRSVDAMIRPRWMHPKVFVAVLVILGFSMVGYLAVDYAINKYFWAFAASLMSAFS